jgi:hypothetical protein
LRRIGEYVVREAGQICFEEIIKMPIELLVPIVIFVAGIVISVSAAGMGIEVMLQNQKK